MQSIIEHPGRYITLHFFFNRNVLQIYHQSIKRTSSVDQPHLEIDNVVFQRCGVGADMMIVNGVHKVNDPWEMTQEQQSNIFLKGQNFWR